MTPTTKVVQLAWGSSLIIPTQLLHGVAFGFGHAKQLIELSHCHKNGDAHHEAVHHRLGQELCDKTQASPVPPPERPGR